MGTLPESHPVLTQSHPVLKQWIAAVTEKDMEDLASLYDKEAIVRGFQEELRGIDEILDHLLAYRRQLRKMALAGIEALHQSDGGLRFETVVRSMWGERRVQHAWTLAGDRISQHEMVLVGS